MEKSQIWEIPINGRRYSVRLTYKKMRYIRLRVLPGGEIRLSAPVGVDPLLLKQFLSQRGDWLARQSEQMKTQKRPDKQPPLTKEERREALSYLQPIVDKLYPIVKAHGVARPHMTVRAMRTRYGSCSVNRGRITLNAILTKVPKPAAEYVVLHELAHFLHPNHGRQFYAFVERHMPDWREREALLAQSDPAADLTDDRRRE